ncbi:hypothetical protein HanLR1_Chr16g0634861 [Helianthus annuus]|nr:hypothetical protein HanLR1_Chr16g0634861 [Helianthus annuus]
MFAMLSRYLLRRVGAITWFVFAGLFLVCAPLLFVLFPFDMFLILYLIKLKPTLISFGIYISLTTKQLVNLEEHDIYSLYYMCMNTSVNNEKLKMLMRTGQFVGGKGTHLLALQNM